MSANCVRAALAAALLAVLAIVLAACGQEGAGQSGNTGKNEQELVDNGPNAGLSNDVLLGLAMDYTGMSEAAGIRSLRIDEIGRFPPDNFSGPSDWTVRWRADMQSRSNGLSEGRIDYIRSNNVVTKTTTLLNTSDGRAYMSEDGGETWALADDLVLEGFGLAAWYYLSAPVAGDAQEWSAIWGTRIQDGTPVPAGQRGGLTFRDGSPRLEKIDGVVTRHMVADVPDVPDVSDVPPTVDSQQGTYGMPFPGIKSVAVWVSTEVTPTLRRLVVEGTRDETVVQNPVGRISSVAFSPDGKTLAAGYDADDTDAYGRLTYAGAVRLWNVDSPDDPPTRLWADKGLSRIAYSPDGRYLAASNGNPVRVYLWDLGTQRPVSTTLPLEDTGGSDCYITFRPDGKMLAVAPMGGLFVWQLPNRGEQPVSLPVSGLVGDAMVFSPDNSALAASYDRAVWLYDTNDLSAPPRKLADIKGEARDMPEDLVFSPDGKVLAGSSSNNVMVWKLEEASPLLVVLPGPESYGSRVAFSPDGKLLAASAPGGKVRVWDVGQLVSASSAPAPLAELGGGEGWPRSAPFSPDSRFLATSGENGKVQIWDVQQLVGAQAGSPVGPVLVLDAPGGTLPVTFSPDGKRLAGVVGDVGDTEDTEVLLWNVESLYAPDKTAPSPPPWQLSEEETRTPVEGEPYTVTWQWSRFNEDFGVIEPPPTEKIKQP